MSGLWIAFKNLYLCDGEHPLINSWDSAISCELLSKICIFVTANINHQHRRHGQAVVNCFQKFVSLWRRTSPSDGRAGINGLWIAFKNLYLCDGEHPSGVKYVTYDSCELLSKICIFVTANIIVKSTNLEYIVVNCFQKFVSLWRRTSRDLSMLFAPVLWIAFKNLYLCDGEHLWAVSANA